MKSIVFILLASLVAPFWYTNESGNDNDFSIESSVSEVLFALGEPKPDHYLEYSQEQVQWGKELIHLSKVNKPPLDKTSKYISKFYNCTSCHNTKREDVDLSKINPDERLIFAKENNLPYLPGSTFWGITNRETWYNDDYVKKYGNLVEKAKYSLKGSVQLCAEVCSQGRTLDDWELNSILAYFWSLEMKISDLHLNQTELDSLLKLSASDAIANIKSRYLQKSPAHIGDVPKNKKKGYDFKGNPDSGKIIYENGCQHCHRIDGESDVILDNYKSTFKWLKSNIKSDYQLSIYEIIRKGTYSENGHKEYMPLYPIEKLSDQQIEDLRAYIEMMAK